MKIHLLFTTRFLTTANVDMSKNIKWHISKKLNKKKLMFQIQFSGEIKSTPS